MASTAVNASRAEDGLALVIITGHLPFSEVGFSGHIYPCLPSCDPTLNVYPGGFRRVVRVGYHMANTLMLLTAHTIYAGIAHRGADLHVDAGDPFCSKFHSRRAGGWYGL